jgi:hypothetical protein
MFKRKHYFQAVIVKTWRIQWPGERRRLQKPSGNLKITPRQSLRILTLSKNVHKLLALFQNIFKTILSLYFCYILFYIFCNNCISYHAQPFYLCLTLLYLLSEI